MKKKGWMLVGLVAAVLLAGCKTEPKVPIDAILEAIDKAEAEKTTMPVETPDVAFDEPFRISAGETLVVGRSGIELTMNKIFYEEAVEATYFVYEMEIDGKSRMGEGWSDERGNRILQREFTELEYYRGPG